MSHSAETPDARVLDRARGCLVGLAVGEALGRPLEALTREQARRELAAEPRFATGRGDQAAMAMLFAESLLAHGRLNPADASRRLLDWIRGGARDIGRVAARALYLQSQGQPWADSARTAWEENQPRGATAEGLARGVSLALLPGRDEAVLARDSLAASALTHFDPRCRWAAAALNLMLARFLRGAGQGLPGAILGLLTERHVFRTLEEVPTLVLAQLESRNDALVALQAATWCTLDAADFSEAVLAAVALGGSAPLVGALTGALAGARFGERSIHQEWRAAIQDADALGALAESLVRMPPPPIASAPPPERRNGPVHGTS